MEDWPLLSHSHPHPITLMNPLLPLDMLRYRPGVEGEEDDEEDEDAYENEAAAGAWFPQLTNPNKLECLAELATDEMRLEVQRAFDVLLEHGAQQAFLRLSREVKVGMFAALAYMHCAHSSTPEPLQTYAPEVLVEEQPPKQKRKSKASKKNSNLKNASPL